MLNVQLLLTGNELMSGDIVDSNSAMIAQNLAEIGVAIKRKVTVSDEFSDLVSEIELMSQQADLLIINGGLGPTVDDLTAVALAEVAKLEIVQHPEALAHLTDWCEKRNFKLNEPNLKQTMLPNGCEVVPNAIGSAVGFKLNINQCDVYCTPGVPVELKLMLAEQIIPSVESQLPTVSHHHVSRYQVFGIGESSLQKLVDEQLPDWPEDIELGFRASMPILELKLTSKTALAKLNKAKWLDKIRALIGDHIVGEITDKPKSFGEHIQHLLRAQNKKITFAESCTGGMLASAMTRISGASEVFDASFVTYSNLMKQNIVNVSPQTLEKYGAVSKETVIEMAMGALDRTQANLVVSVSGVAGPTGGSDEKPVGTVWIAWGEKENLNTTCLYIPGNRYYFQHYVTAISLDLVRRMLINSNEIPKYLIERQKA
ncbi:CinA family nicotinamide mononucleotide deamidase-related protein [Thalassotalea sp. M1531]|uniref:CinA-like protein n=1 Tax=Thalassotalea algicola TaxID=2716224 RepID=A0A7Y0LF12_9GAMM|nr:CinA family nicotinamide mononucleotide deamidase-related protein [Thalassotalea algicola]NMP33324.1 CinA family nicotinamide mononucleotide deamidase-related protein [Thalassotalea algicola]